MEIEKFIACSCFFASISLFAYYLMKKTQTAYLSGQDILSQTSNRLGLEIKEFELIISSLKYAAMFLALVENLKKNNGFGIKEKLAELEETLIRGGLRSKITSEEYFTSSITFSVVFGLMFSLLAYLFGYSLVGILFLGLPAGAIVGFYVPKFILSSYVSNRISLIEKRLPFAIEFMLLAMEANASFPLAVRVYTEQMKSDPLAEEMQLALNDIDRGLSIQNSLSNLAARINSELVSAFILATNTGLETGQPLKEVLKTQADAIRQQRFQNAEVIAKTASTKATFPLFIALIGVIILLIAPLLIKSVRDFSF